MPRSPRATARPRRRSRVRASPARQHHGGARDDQRLDERGGRRPVDHSVDRRRPLGRQRERGQDLRRRLHHDHPATADNPTGTTHVLTAQVFVNRGDGAGYVAAPNGTAVSFALLSGSVGSFVGGSGCTTTGGACTATITSTAGGADTVQASMSLSVGGLSLTRTTGTAAPGHANSGNAGKNWIPPTTPPSPPSPPSPPPPTPTTPTTPIPPSPPVQTFTPPAPTTPAPPARKPAPFTPPSRPKIAIVKSPKNHHEPWQRPPDGREGRRRDRAELHEARPRHARTRSVTEVHVQPGVGQARLRQRRDRLRQAAEGTACHGQRPCRGAREVQDGLERAREVHGVGENGFDAWGGRGSAPTRRRRARQATRFRPGRRR